FKAIAAQELGMFCFSVEIAETGNEYTSGLAVFIDWITAGQDRKETGSPDAAEVIDEIVTKYPGTITKPLRMLPGFGVQKNSRGFQGRGGNDDHFAEDFTLFMSYSINKGDAGSLARVRVHDDMANNGVRS